jgi:hypothetical protein
MKDRPALVEIDKEKRKLEKQEAERRRYLVSGCTRERLFFFYKRKKKEISFVIICLIKTTGTEIICYNDISNSITRKKRTKIFISYKHISI